MVNSIIRPFGVLTGNRAQVAYCLASPGETMNHENLRSRKSPGISRTHHAIVTIDGPRVRSGTNRTPSVYKE